MRLRGLRAIVRRRVRYRITRGGILFSLAIILTGAGAFLSANNLLFLIFSAMLALVLVSGFLSRLVLSGLEIELLLPQHVSARTAEEARLRIRNLKRFVPSFSIELAGTRDPLTKSPSILGDPVYFPLIAGRASIETPVQVTFPYRGRHRENVFVVSTRFPFGFLRKTATVSLRRETIVYPALLPEGGTGLYLQEVLGDIEAQYRGIGKDFYSIRPYEPNDSARNVDWKSTAHTGRLQVREFAREQQRTVEIFLDRHIAGGEEAWFESAVEGCAWLAWELSEREIETHFRSQRHSIYVPQDGDVYDILRSLALVEPIRVFKGEAPAEPPSDDSSYKIVFTSRPPDFASEGWHAAHLVSPSLEPDVKSERSGPNVTSEA